MNNSKYLKIKPNNISGNAFNMIGEEWFLITAGPIDSFNTMTAAWGSFGVLWHRPVVTCFVRPTRHTYNFMERSEYFTLCFFEDKYRDILNFCGSRSGRDTNKMIETGLIPLLTENENVFFEQARMVIECKKQYFHDLDPEIFLDERIHKDYPAKDYHRMYIGEIIDCFAKK